MIKNHKFLSLFAITLCAALLLSMGSRATRVFALADPSPEVWISPVFDTTIYQFSDYVENLSDPQYEIFKIALGIYACTQMGASQYQLNDPFDTRDGVIGWFKSTGLQLYNSLIALVPDTTRDPISGAIISTTELKEKTKFLVAYGMGAAVLAANYQTEQDFIDDINNSTNFFIQYGVDIQPNIKDLIAVNGGFYNWQFETSDFQTTLTYASVALSGAVGYEYMDFITNLTDPVVRFNYPYYAPNSYNGRAGSSTWFSQYHNLFIDIVNHSYTFYDDNGYTPNYGDIIPLSSIWAWNNNGYQLQRNTGGFYWTYPIVISNYSAYTSVQALVQDIYNSVFLSSGASQYFYQDFVEHVYIGSSWSSKQEVTLTTDLNLALNDIAYYNQIQSDYLFDIKQYIDDLLNTVDLYFPWINNLFTPDGIRVTDPKLTRVSVEILNTLNDMNPPLPVNLNNISELTENTYLDLVKQHGENFGETIGEYVAFWHNSDPEITYVIFGALILTLIGAFVGKWGHS